MKQNNKICILTDSLSSGGAEKMAAHMSISLSKRGYNVHVVSMKDEIDYPFLGVLYNFGKVKSQYNKLQCFFKFRTFFKEQQFDLVIDHRVRHKFIKEFLFSRFVFKRVKVIYCVHHYSLELYFSIIGIPMLSRLVLVKNRKLVAVSKVAKQKIKERLSLESQVIHNYTLPKKEKYDTVPEGDFIVAVGRLEKIKQFDVLIKSYANSKLPKSNIKLLILGEGIEREQLVQLISKLGMQHKVELLGFKTNVSAYIKKAKALVMSSAYEGFPMVLIEALALKTPVISFDCKSGPSEIIQHEINGLLVEDQNKEMLALAMESLILDKVFYDKIKDNLLKQPNKFSEENIIGQWLKLLDEF